MNGSLADYYHWEEADRGIRIYMHAGMADRLQAEILRGGAEVGGILLGRVEDDQGKSITFIDDFAPVPCSYHAGPLYTLSGEDAANLEAALLRTALAGCESPDAPSVIGYYRSHMREGLSLSASDLAVIESYFQAPTSVFLLVKAAAGTKGCVAGFFFWEDGSIQSEFSSLEVALGRTGQEMADQVPSLCANLNGDLGDDLPADLAELFRKAALPGPSSVATAEAELFEPSAQPPVGIGTPRTETGKTPRAWHGVLLRAATISIASAALVISVVTYLGAPRPREEAAGSMPASILGLQAERNPPDLLVTWNRNAREIVVARRATLSIRDGNVETSVDLNKAQLASGSYLYTPSNDDIQLRLEVYEADDGSVAQSIRMSSGSQR